MVIHKVKESDYAESEPATSVLNMARTLAPQLHAGGTSRRLRGARERRPGAAEAERTWIAGSSRRTAATRRADLSRSRGAGGVLDLDPSYCDGEIRRPRDSPAIRVHLRRADEREAGDAREACRGCGGPADTLLVELANALEGAVTVCTGDSDLVAFSRQREGRSDSETDNRSYREDRAMHDSPFGSCSSRTPRERGLGSSARDASSRRSPEPQRRGSSETAGCCPAPGAARGLRAHPEDHGEPRSDQRRSTTCTGRRQRPAHVAFLGRFFESDARTT
ncbi:hypothetical protein Q5P01_000062 [Channa striata]|uniref:Uncharacterized protein n=1 Tax=Channa striata TaxID=64152 RepID=A0AA88IH28_CHASR|nr:hypothetical protein Q5P01_000062 [Channa striata]